MWIRKGSVNKLVIYTQGGGACWDDTTCITAPQCDQTVDAGDSPAAGGNGFADWDNVDNPFRDWHIVFIPYCTCDVFWGNNRATYNGSIGGYHKGRVNQAYAEKWAREHFVNPDQVFVSGSSAGAYGAITGGLWLHEVYPSSQFDILPDAGYGVIPDAFLDGDIANGDISNWGALDTLPRHVEGLDVDTLVGLNLSNVIINGANHYESRGTRIAPYTTSWDFVQTLFYNAQVFTNPLDRANWRLSTCDWNAQMTSLDDQLTTSGSPNIRTYVAGTSDHTVYGSSKVYNEAITIKGGTLGVDPAITLRDFVADMIDHENSTGDWQNVACDAANGECDHIGNHGDGSSDPLPVCP